MRRISETKLLVKEEKYVESIIKRTNNIIKKVIISPSITISITMLIN